MRLTYLLPDEILIVGAGSQVHDLELGRLEIAVGSELNVWLVQIALDGHVAQVLEKAEQEH